MTLKQWLEDHKHSAEWMADKLGTTRQNVTNWSRDKFSPSLYWVQAIAHLTDGEVGLFDWDTEPQAKRKSPITKEQEP